MTKHASGSFDVTLVPQGSPDAAVGRMSIDKVLYGDLEGTSKGEMLASMFPAAKAAVYVALEQITGTLHGLSGTFVLMHNGISTQRGQEFVVTVAPDSGQATSLASAVGWPSQSSTRSTSTSSTTTLPRRRCGAAMPHLVCRAMGW